MKVFLQLYCVCGYLLCNEAKAQVNMIQNGSFEDLNSCPDYSETVSTINYALGWNDMRATGVSEFYNSPDLFNTCVSSDFPGTLSVPHNWYGYQEPYEGEGYSGIAINSYPEGGPRREFMQNELLNPIIQGCKYKVSFQFSYGENYSYRTNGLYFIFSNHKITIPNNQAMLNGTYFYFDEDSVTVLRFPELLDADTTGWWYFEREFYSNAPAKYLTIGSISDSANTNNEFGWATLPFGQVVERSNGYFDDIRLIQLDSNCVTGVNEIEKKESVKVYPNPILNELNIITQFINGKFEVTILDATGRIITNQQFAGSGTNTLVLNGLAKGIYYCRITQGNELIFVEKVVKVE